MGLLNDKPPKRPQGWKFASIAELYQLFEGLFLDANGLIESKCGHQISIFDHHLFHMCGITRDSTRLFMPEEKEALLALTDGFGEYQLVHGGSRARDLPSAHATLLEPDEVWCENPRASSAEWIYIKEFDSRPYPFSIALLKRRTKGNGIIVPLSSFCCKKNRIRAWRETTRLYP
jgi:hypothetical protein